MTVCTVVLLLQSMSAEIRVVSLSPIASKALLLLEAENEVVACTKWCPFATEKLVVANAIDVNVEQVLRAQPDVIFASTLTSHESIETMQQLGMEVIILPRMTSFEAICQNLIIIGDKVGRKQLAEKEVAQAKARLKELKTKIPKDINAPRTMFQVGSNPVFVAMPNTFINDYIVQSGAVNIYSDLEHGTVTRESVITRNPEAIFISTMPGAAENTQELWMGYKELSAAQKGQVVLIDQELASSPTVHTFVDVVELMIETLY